MVEEKPVIKTNHKERGNVFFALFGAVAVVGVIGAASMSIMRGPLTTMVEVNKRTQAESQMQLAGRMAIVQSAEQSASGDCDSDGFIEPILPAAFGTTPGGTLANGGALPNTIGATKTDPWGTEYGYCVWNAGPVDSGGGCSGSLIDGSGDSSEDYAIISIISAGPDRTFSTNCQDYATAGAGNKLAIKPSGTDDIIMDFTYGEAQAFAGGLWRIKSGDPATAEISKELEVTGGARFSGASTLDLSGLTGSLLLPDDVTSGACNAANDGVVRRNTSTSPPTVEICDFSGGSGWVSVAAGATTLTQLSDGDTRMEVNDTVPEVTIDVDGTEVVSVDTTTLDASTLDITTTGDLAAGNTTLTGTLNVTSDVDFDSNLNVDGTVTITNGGGADPALAVSGDVTAANVDLTGDLTLGDNESIFWGAGTVNITGSSAGDALTLNAGETSLSGNLTAIDITGTGDANLNALTVDTVATISNGGGASIALTVGGDIDVNGDASIAGDIFDVNNATLTGKLEAADGEFSGDVQADSFTISSAPNVGVDLANLPDCDNANDKLTWSSGSGWGCGADTSGGSSGDPNDEIQNLQQVLTEGNSAGGLNILNVGTMAVGSSTVDGTLELDVTGDIGAGSYCNSSGVQCFTTDEMNQDLGEVLGVGNDAGGLTDLLNLQGLAIGSSTISSATNTNLVLDVTGDIGAIEYCDADGLNCFDPAAVATLVGGAVTEIDDLTDAYHDITSDFNTNGLDDDDNLVLGHEFSTNTSGWANTAIGATALIGNTSGAGNVAVGLDALNANTTGSGNTAIGHEALANATSASNTAVGSSALRGNTTGSANVAIGDDALAGNTIGGSNIALGFQAFDGANEGDSNVVLGMRASRNNTTGGGNIVLGTAGHAANTTGSSNIAIGQNSLRNNVTGNQNVAVGISAGGNGSPADGDMDRNVMIGYQAGYNLTGGATDGTGANNNVLLGALAGDNITLGDNNIILGYGIDASSATVSNEINIGNTIFGDISTDRVGIGMANATIIDSSALFQLDSTTLGFLMPRMTGGERDLIASPATGLQVYNTTTDTVDYYDGTTWVSFASTAGNANRLIDADSDTSIEVDTATDGSANITVFTNNGTESMRIDATGNLGVGTNNPSDKITVLNGNVSVREDDDGNPAVELGAGLQTGYAAFFNDGTANTLIRSAVGSETYFNAGNVVFGNTTADASARVQIDATTQGFLLPRVADPLNDIALPATGLIAYDSTDNELQVYDGSNWVTFSGAGANIIDRIQDGDNDTFIDVDTADDDDIRITMSGEEVLTLIGNTGTPPVNNMNLTMRNGSSGGTNYFTYAATGGATFGRMGYDGSASAMVIQSDTASSILFRTGGSNERLRILNGGNVGIGASAANTTSLLTVANGDFVLKTDGATGTDAIQMSADASTGTFAMRNGPTTRVRFSSSSGSQSFFNQGNFVFGNSTANDSAQLQVDAADAGFLPPRIADPANDIATPATGLIAYDSTDNELQVYDGTSWVTFSGSGAAADADWQIDSINNYVYNMTDNIGIGTSAPSYSLHVNNGNIGLTNQGNNAYLRIGMDENNNESGTIGTGIILRNDASDVAHLNFIEAATNLLILNNSSSRASPHLTIASDGRIGMGVAGADLSARLQLDSTSQGFLPPRINDPANDIATPATGLIAYDSTDNELQVYDGTSWVTFSGSGAAADADWQIDSVNNYVYNTTDSIGIGTATPASILDIYGDNEDVYHTSISSGGGNAVHYGADYIFRRTAGGAIVSDDYKLGGLRFQADDGNTYRLGAAISANIDGTPGSSDVPTRLEFHVAADGGVVDQETDTPEMVIKNNGNVGIGIAGPVGQLHIDGSGNPGKAIIIQNDVANRTSEIVFRDGTWEFAKIGGHTNDSSGQPELRMNAGNTQMYLYDMGNDNNTTAALDLSYTVNKGTGTGNDFGLRIQKTDTASPGISRLIDARTDGTVMHFVDDDGLGFLRSGLTVGAFSINGSAVLQADATDKGFLPPRIADPANDVTTPATGLIAYDSTDNELQVYDGTSWVTFSGSGAAADADWQIDSGNGFVYNMTDSIGIGTATPNGLLQIAGAGMLDNDRLISITEDGDTLFSVTARDGGRIAHGPSRFFGVCGIGSYCLEINNQGLRSTDHADIQIVSREDELSGNYGIALLNDGLMPTGVPLLKVGIGTNAATAEYLRVDSTGGLGIGTGAENDASALMEISSTSRGFLPPRINDPANDIATPATGLIAYDSTDNELQVYDGTSWVTFSGGGAAADADWQIDSVNNYVYNMTDNIGIGTSAPNVILDVVKSQDASTTIGVNNPNPGTSAEAMFFASNGAQSLAMGVNGTGFATDPGAAYIWNIGNTDLMIGTSDTERMRITSGGNVGIGAAATIEGVVDINASGFAVPDLVFGNGSSGKFGFSATGNGLTIQRKYSGGFQPSSLSINRGTGNVAINVADPASIDASAILQVDATDRGFLPPRINDPANDIATPATGLIAYDSTDNELQVYDGTSWVTFSGGAAGAIAINDLTDASTTADSMYVGSGAAPSAVGVQNTVLGIGAFVNATSGINNTFIGWQAGGNAAMTDGQMDNNTAIGERAGYSLSSGASGNIFLGQSAGANETSGDNNIIIGNNISTSGFDAQSELNIGNTFFADMTNAATGDAGAARVGINSATPASALEINYAGTPSDDIPKDVATLTLRNTATQGGAAIQLFEENSQQGFEIENYSSADSSTNYLSFKSYPNSPNPIEFLRVHRQNQEVQFRNLTVGGPASYVSQLRLMENVDASEDGVIFEYDGANNIFHMKSGFGGTYPEIMTVQRDVRSVAFGTAGVAAAASAQLEVASTTKGFLPPRIADPAGDVTAPATGLIAYDSTDNELQVYDGTSWVTFSGGGAAAIAIGDLTDATTDYVTDFNMFMGAGAGASIASGGQYNLAIGQSAGTALTTGDGNVALGYQALNAAQDNQQSVAVGYRAAASTNNTHRLVAVGGYAAENWDGDGWHSMVAIGHQAAQNLTTGAGITAIGNEALHSFPGDRNTAVGNLALFTSNGGGGSENIAMGEFTGGYMAGSGNVLLGYEAFKGGFSGDFDHGGDNNIFIGRNSARDVTGSATSQNTFVGSQTGLSLRDGVGNILIGYGTDVTSSTSSNELNIGNTIYGDLANGYVGIGTSSPTHKLEVLDGSIVLKEDDDGNIAVEIASDNSTGWIELKNAGSNTVFLSSSTSSTSFFNNGPVVFGNTTLDASAKLQIDSITQGFLPPRIADPLNDITSPATGLIAYDSTDNELQVYNGTAWEAFSGGSAGAIAINDLTDALSTYGTTDNLALGQGAGAALGSGGDNVFMGVNAGAILITGSENIAIGKGALGNQEGSNNVVIGDNAGTSAGPGSNIIRNVMLGDGAGSSSDDAQDNVYIGYNVASGNDQGARNVVIGSVAGQVFANASDNILIGYGVESSVTGASNELNIGDAIFGDLSNDNIGIGTNDPSDDLHVYDSAGNGKVVIEGAANAQTTIDMIMTGDGGTHLDEGTAYGWQIYTYNGSWGDASRRNDFGISYFNGGFQDYLYMDSNTYSLGIFNTSPDAALDVTGDIEYTGTITDVSDRRLKTDIHKLNTDDVIAKLAQIDTYSFKMKDDEAGRVEYGVMAQDLEKLFPELVKTANDEMGTKSVNYMGLIAPMIEATKALKSENDDLKAELTELKSQQAEVLAAVKSLNTEVKGLKVHTGFGIKQANSIAMMILMLMVGGLSVLLFIQRKRYQNNQTE